MATDSPSQTTCSGGCEHKPKDGAEAGLEHRCVDAVEKAPVDDAHEAVDAGRHRRTVFDVTGLCCQSEVALIDDALSAVDGVDDHAINIAAGTLAIYHDGDSERVQQVVEHLNKVGLKATPRRSVGREAAVDTGAFSAHLWVIVAGVLLSGLGAWLRYGMEMMTVSAFVFASAIGVGGFFVFRQAAAGVRRRTFNIPILVTIAVVGAGIIGEWFEAATVIILFAFAEWLESQSMARARREIGALMELAPQMALRVDDDGGVEEVSVDEVDIGDRLRVRPGANIPVDGLVERGRSEVDESTITGESVPVLKQQGDAVYSGTVNGPGAITIEAVQPASKSTLAHIIDAIEEARENRSPTEQFIERFARVYTPAVVAVAALVALIPPLVFGADGLEWFYRALVFLVIACPCALVISTPIANVAGLARAARQGVLVKGGRFLEMLGRLEAVAFDKTGTLTRGRPAVEAIRPFLGWNQQSVLLAAARVEADSEHHIGRAIVDEMRHRVEPAQFVDRARQVEASVGEGIEAVIDAEDLPEIPGEEVAACVGTVTWLRARGVGGMEEVEQGLRTLERGGRTVVGVAVDEVLVGLVALEDAPRPEASEALAGLRSRGIADAYVVTGDNEATARAIGAELELDDERVFARLLPAEKVEKMETLRRRHQEIAMVGDGVNDAPALAGASVGVAMGAAGTDVALESADVALMSDDLRRLGRAVDIGRKTTRVIYQNIAVALGLKAVFLVLAILGIATLWMAIVADMGASLIVIFNAIRLLRTDSTSEGESAAERRKKPRIAGA